MRLVIEPQNVLPDGQIQFNGRRYRSVLLLARVGQQVRVAYESLRDDDIYVYDLNMRGIGKAGRVRCCVVTVAPVSLDPIQEC